MVGTPENCICWVEVKDATKHPTVYTVHNQNDNDLNVSNAEVEKPWSKFPNRDNWGVCVDCALL